MRRTLTRSGRSSKREQGPELSLLFPFRSRFTSSTTNFAYIYIHTATYCTPSPPSSTSPDSFPWRLTEALPSLFPILFGPLWITQATGPCLAAPPKNGRAKPSLKSKFEGTDCSYSSWTLQGSFRKEESFCILLLSSRPRSFACPILSSFLLYIQIQG